MPDEPQTWHYGLVARWWAEFNRPRTDELRFYRSAIDRFGQPALDLCCGTGRLLLPLLEAGLDVDGCDLSPDMLALCRERTPSGLEPHLHQQAMHELDLTRSYRTIYICDSFGLGGTRQQDEEALRRCCRHLEPGGALVFSNGLPYDAASTWRLWLPDQRGQLPAPWPDKGDRRRAANGDEIELRTRLIDVDPLEQRLTMEMRAILWREGKLVLQEERLLIENLYFRNELLSMLAHAGFADVSVTGGYTDAPPKPTDTMLVFIAVKGAGDDSP